MIELLNARRMIIVIGVLIVLCIIIVILEDTITDHVDRPTPVLDYHHLPQLYNHSNIKGNQNRPLNKPTIHELINQSNSSADTISKLILTTSCWEHESFVTKKRCSPCQANERLLSYCIDTGYKELVHCEKYGDQYRSCDIHQSPSDVTSFFWVFEFFMICISLVFNFYVRRRQSLLNRLVLERIEKQISCGV